jgi:hypothetical protein
MMMMMMMMMMLLRTTTTTECAFYGAGNAFLSTISINPSKENKNS